MELHRLRRDSGAALNGRFLGVLEELSPVVPPGMGHRIVRQPRRWIARHFAPRRSFNKQRAALG